MEANKGILQSKFTDNVTNKTKTETWKAITEKLNAIGVASRTIYKLKQKWKGLFSTAKKEFSQQKKVQRKMGGGPAPGEPSKTSKMIVEHMCCFIYCVNALIALSRVCVAIVTLKWPNLLREISHFIVTYCI